MQGSTDPPYIWTSLSIDLPADSVGWGLGYQSSD